MIKFTKSIIRCILGWMGYQIKPISSGKVSPIRFWDDDVDFNQLYQSISGNTVVSKSRCYFLYQFARHAMSLTGDVAEVGVYKGGTARLLAVTFIPHSEKAVHIFDTFSGLPPADPIIDVYYRGKPRAFEDVTLQHVQAYLQTCSNVLIYPGLFPGTSGPIEDKIFCMVHIDVDIYRSVIDCCEFFYPRMTRGGIVIFDDYGDYSCSGARQAVDEFFVDKPENPCYIPTGQCLVVRQ